MDMTCIFWLFAVCLVLSNQGGVLSSQSQLTDPPANNTHHTTGHTQEPHRHGHHNGSHGHEHHNNHGNHSSHGHHGNHSSHGHHGNHGNQSNHEHEKHRDLINVQESNSSDFKESVQQTNIKDIKQEGITEQNKGSHGNRKPSRGIQRKKNRNKQGGRSRGGQRDRDHARETVTTEASVEEASLEEATQSYDDDEEELNWELREAHTYVKNFFRKYGHDGVLTFEGFEHLLNNLGLGDIDIVDHDIHDHKVEDGFVEFHETHDHTNETSSISDNFEVSRSHDDSDHHNNHQDNEHHGENEHHGDNGQHDDRENEHHGDHHDDHDHEHHGDNDHHDNHDHEHNRLKRELDENHGHDHEVYDESCLSPRQILYLYKVPDDRPLTFQDFLYLCPAILYQIDGQTCARSTDSCKPDHVAWEDHCSRYHGIHEDSYHGDGEESVTVHTFLDIPGKVWGFAILSVTIISLVGLVCVAVVPIINKALFNHLIQVLVALAVGTLTGDAVLHLIPHALISHDDSSHDSSHGAAEDDHSTVVYKGLVVLGGAYLFFIAERVMALCTARRKRRRQRRRSLVETAMELTSLDQNDCHIGQKLSQYQRNSMYVTCATTGDIDENTPEAELEELQQSEDGHHDNKKLDDGNHGHSHSHGTPGSSVSSVAWMVIMGDGLHNFTDGLAIGAAFANSLTVGLSTSIAVFCHELPHELGDFAVLLKSGMSVKHALFYNGVSSILCFLGLVIGVAVGNISAASTWIFAMTAGIFIYISLVDMLPEMTPDADDHTCCSLVLQIVGISIGVGIMLVIALFEKKITVG